MKYISYFLTAIATALVVILLSLSSCSPNHQSTAPTNQSQVSAANTNGTVKIVNFKYMPETLKIAAGETVQFVNKDEEPHTVTSTSGAFDSKALDTEQSWSHTFNQPGNFPYLCSIHPYMKGTINVTSKGNGK
ncbi:cupredoxin family copper-binding protein [Aetokthonos hydrillicola Thurmond2011]|jgi:plastocyanin|uniref:Cupredoxin family copper-binding protein n=1 Tax=Aetokthonos hydrillicola Thurmond2011 TaxID=2712845 RepID=A0AAP5MC64_9CYAN|nr:cupredoxin family copper-binding protein [Aetokthonos hydrillicola]MBO3461093.1 cupredoxin family copper-binding protein [Aetokthonos hydrillicola CCALA 1050]MBW4590686.1 cupredoxin family copper-binding protein [Aetokthonos hydrillicola CCALA 1050]MDR9897664.1 cupredoxin family copper-binding protein [Aetokthonos hydrillicola Thurmond2011]